MHPVVKKAALGFAATKGFEKIQELRKPRQSFLRRNIGKLLFVGLAGAVGTYLYRSGKLSELTGGGRTSYQDDYPTGPGTAPIPAVDASGLEPAGV